MVWPLVRFAGASIISTFDLANNILCAISQPERECNENEWGAELGTIVVKFLKEKFTFKLTLPSISSHCSSIYDPLFLLESSLQSKTTLEYDNFPRYLFLRIYMWARNSFCDIEIKLERKKYISNCFRNKWFDFSLAAVGWLVCIRFEWMDINGRKLEPRKEMEKFSQEKKQKLF